MCCSSYISLVSDMFHFRSYILATFKNKMQGALHQEYMVQYIFGTVQKWSLPIGLPFCHTFCSAQHSKAIPALCICDMHILYYIAYSLKCMYFNLCIIFSSLSLYFCIASTVSAHKVKNARYLSHVYLSLVCLYFLYNFSHSFD